MKARTWKDSWRKGKPAGWLRQFAGGSQVWDGPAEATTWGQEARSRSNENWALCKTLKDFKGLDYTEPRLLNCNYCITDNIPQ